MFVIIRNIFIHIRSILKVTFLIVIAAVIIIGILSLIYKPTYSVTLNGEFIGYTSNKSSLQKRINEYMEKGEENNIAFVDIEELPQYSLCFLKKGVETNDDEIFEKVKSTGKSYYEYYAIVLNSEEKYYVGTDSEAEEIIDELKEKKSKNASQIAYTKVHATELKEFTGKDDVVKALYVKQPTYVASSAYKTYTGNRIASTEVSSASVLGINIIKPVSGLITSRFGARSRGNHTGLDIATSYGTTIVAAAGGTVTFSGNRGNGYGNYVIISHGGGVQTLYGHCSALYVTEGQTVSQGEAIAAVGSTGNSTGNHLHFEIRINGEYVNPQNYLY